MMMRLVTGEEILAEVTDETSTTFKYKIKNPVRILVVPTKNDPKTPQVALAPFAEFAAIKEFGIEKSHVLMVYEPVQEFVNQYKELFGGIITPPKKLILPT